MIKQPASASVRVLVFSVLSILFTGYCSAQGPALDSDFPNINKSYVNPIRSIRLYKEGNELNQPVIALNSNERLVIAFDDLSAELRRIQYTIRHCSYDWKNISDLVASDFIDGFREQNVEQYQYSYNTTVPFVHYSGFLPTDNLRPKLSGNYLLVVYEEDTRQVLFTQRFMVTESSPVTMVANVQQGLKIEEKQTHQQVDILVKLNGFRTDDVNREVRLAIRQNTRWDNMKYILKPRIARPDELDYRFDEEIAFPGWNQYRYFDTKSLLYQSEYIRKINYDTVYHVYLLDDQPRTYKQYVHDNDLNGRYFIKNEEHAQNSDTEADYAMVGFFLPYPVTMPSGRFHIIGDLTSWQSDDYSQMIFNPVRKGYELTLFLKQGYYNYLYVYRSNDGRTIDENMVEGSHWETENEYDIMLYYRLTGANYDRLISFNTINSRNVK